MRVLLTMCWTCIGVPSPSDVTKACMAIDFPMILLLLGIVERLKSILAVCSRALVEPSLKPLAMGSTTSACPSCK